MVLCGDIMLTPNLSLSMATADNMVAQWEKVCNKLGSLKALLPCCYWYISNFMLDCVVLSCTFPLDAGLWWVDAISWEIPIPFVCFSQVVVNNSIHHVLILPLVGHFEEKSLAFAFDSQNELVPDAETSSFQESKAKARDLSLKWPTKGKIKTW
ncbi:hypothetical protein DSO57_1020810 [Entomophthora muscae]|uniref:Uncharacterized protein n=1 Tax=Entomophthora muscae TaxID=34485 RepID=A0ACC2U1M5_9FUNG|nr:hypothetical protein DSO57_1020810 [Entomophthora muscae]